MGPAPVTQGSTLLPMSAWEPSGLTRPGAPAMGWRVWRRGLDRSLAGWLEAPASGVPRLVLVIQAAQ